MVADSIVLRLQAVVEELVAADEFSGAVLLAQDEEPLFRAAYGFASQRYGVPNHIDTKFNFGSIGKMFTAVAIVRLAEDGKIEFGDTISEHLPDYRPDIAERVTIHHLLTHTSGMGDYFNERLEAVWADLRTVDDYLPLFRDDSLSFEPGTSWQYSNAGYVVLGAIIERVAGHDYFDFVRDHVYQRAGMENTDAYELDRPVPNLAIGYTHIGLEGTREEGPRRSNIFGLPPKGTPAGGGYSTVEDMLRFGTALRKHVLLSPAFTEILLTGKVEMPVKPGSLYGYGCVEDSVGDQRIVWHNGGAPGISARFDLYRDTGVTLVVLANYDLPIADRIADDVRELLVRA